jgi:DNA mismatch repair protein MutL
MSQIRVLSEDLINKIAAGEVIERPASVVKELVENSLDAGADNIRVDVEEGGRRLIRVQDNGCGMNPDDALLAFERHATSKILQFNDLERVSTLGFRGEALPSISSISKTRLITSDGNNHSGSEILIKGGSIQDVRAAGRAKGTTVEVRDLFYNTPVRKKFLKSHRTELSHTVSVMTEIALAHPDVYFTVRHGNRHLIKTPAVPSLLDRTFQLFGKDLKENFTEVEEGREGLHLFGLVSIPGHSSPTGTNINFFVNRRPVRDTALRHAVYAAYETLLMRGRHPLAYLFLDIDPASIDVNVHPTKREVWFTNKKMVHDFLRDAVRKTVQGYGRSNDQQRGVPDQTAGREERVREAVESYYRTSNIGPGQPERSRGVIFSNTVPTETRKPAPIAQSLFEDRLVPLGQIANSFIVSQDEDGLILIDQHAAHERILYEKFKRFYVLSKIPVQHLLIPVNLELTGEEGILLKESLEILSGLGIDIEDFGHGTFTVKGIPMWVADSNIEELIQVILQEIRELEQSGELERRMEEIIHVFSCRAAIKAHKRLNMEEMETLLKDLQNTDSPHTCEHGRPTMIRFDLQEIEKRFKRT